MSSIYQLGRRVALCKLGMQLQFDSPQQAAAHYKARDVVESGAGFVGGLAGSTAGSMLGSAGGLAGTVGGGLIGGAAGEKMLAAPLTTAMDAAHDVQQRTNSTYNNTLGKLNMAGGMPAGTRM